MTAAGMDAPQVNAMRWICCTLVNGMMPHTMGTLMWARLQRSRKR